MRRAALVLLCGLAAAGAVIAADQVAQPAEALAPLVDAARTRDQASLDALLAARPNVNQRSADGTTALHWAIYHDDVALVERLVAAGADVSAVNDYGSSPLAEAATVGNVAVVRKLLGAGANVESANADGQTALMIVARTSNVEVAKLLLARGASVHVREKWRGQTPLMWAAAQGQPAMVKLLIQHKAKIDERSNLNNFQRQVTAEPRSQARPSGGFTPLLYASRKGCLDCARLLLDAGADVNLTDPDGVSPLLLATLNLNFDIAALFVKKGADVDKWDTWGRSPLFAAVDMNTLPHGGRADRPSADKVSGAQLVKILLDAGANPNLQLKLHPPYRSLRDDRGADQILTVGSTPLLRAARGGDIEVMRLLLARGALPGLPQMNGITPLMAAAGKGVGAADTRGRYRTQEQAIESVQLLLDSGAAIDDRDNQGQTALYGAAALGWNDLVRTLAANRADLNVKDAQGRTAADIAMGTAGGASGRASAQSHPETAALLRQLMAQPPSASTIAAK